ncbi:MAG: competence/damage-inducible protein A [Bacteroidota bacterium]
MQAEIITIGDEILIGQIIDTNSAYIAKELDNIGISIYQVTSVQDDKEHIKQALAAAEKRVEMVIMTGGLGPTKDDITKHTICEYFNDTLIQDNEVLANIEYLFSKYIDTPISDINRQQALVPSKATVLMNAYGTAPGMWLKKNNTVFVLLPGVPYEMKALMQHKVLPRLQDTFNRPYILHKTILTYGMGESAIANKIETWQEKLPEYIKLAYLPNLGKVRLRLTAKGMDKTLLENEVQRQIQQLHGIIGDIIYGLEEDGAIEVRIRELFTEKQQTLATAESCTGGKIAAQLTAVPGASAYFKGSVVSYATQTKTQVLGISEQLIAAHSVVSAEVAEAMARQVKQLLKTDFAVATTGNAGPEKGDSEAEIGTVFIAIATPDTVFSQEFNLGNHRERVVNKAVNKVFELLLKEILKI